MVVAKHWVKIATIVASVALLLFSLGLLCVEAVLLAYAQEFVTTVPAIVTTSFLACSTAWVGISAAISRHRGVYIQTVVLASLTFIDVLGILIVQAWWFSVSNYFAVSVAFGMAYVIIVFLSLNLVIIILLVAFVVNGLVSECPKHPHRRHDEFNHDYMQPGTYGYPPPEYSPGYRYSSPKERAGSWGAPANRVMTVGSPEWDQFYQNFYRGERRKGHKNYAYSARY